MKKIFSLLFLVMVMVGCNDIEYTDYSLYNKDTIIQLLNEDQIQDVKDNEQKEREAFLKRVDLVVQAIPFIIVGNRPEKCRDNGFDHYWPDNLDYTNPKHHPFIIWDGKNPKGSAYMVHQTTPPVEKVFRNVIKYNRTSDALKVTFINHGGEMEDKVFPADTKVVVDEKIIDIIVSNNALQEYLMTADSGFNGDFFDIVVEQESGPQKKGRITLRDLNDDSKLFQTKNSYTDLYFGTLMEKAENSTLRAVETVKRLINTPLKANCQVKIGTEIDQYTASAHFEIPFLFMNDGTSRYFETDYYAFKRIEAEGDFGLYHDKTVVVATNVVSLVHNKNGWIALYYDNGEYKTAECNGVKRDNKDQRPDRFREQFTITNSFDDISSVTQSLVMHLTDNRMKDYGKQFNK